MKYNLTHRGRKVATFDTAQMDPDEVRELKAMAGTFFKVVQTVPDRLPPLPRGYSNLDDIRRNGGGWIPEYLRRGVEQGRRISG